MSTREITGHLHDLYGINVSPHLISTVTDAVATWPQRSLDPVYPLVFFDVLRVKIRDKGMVRNKTIHMALGVRADGGNEVLGLWLEQIKGAKFWFSAMNEVRNRGIEGILLAVVDGLKGFPEAIAAVFPQRGGPDVHRRSASELDGFRLLESPQWLGHRAERGLPRAPPPRRSNRRWRPFEAGPWDSRYAALGESWRRAWVEVIPFFAFPEEVRRIISTTNAIEALNSKLRRAVHARGHFPVTKLLYLILNRSEKGWRKPPLEWTMAKAQFAVIFGEGVIRAMTA